MKLNNLLHKISKTCKNESFNLCNYHYKTNTSATINFTDDQILKIVNQGDTNFILVRINSEYHSLTYDVNLNYYVLASQANLTYQVDFQIYNLQLYNETMDHV